MALTGLEVGVAAASQRRACGRRENDKTSRHWGRASWRREGMHKHSFS